MRETDFGIPEKSGKKDKIGTDGYFQFSREKKKRLVLLSCYEFRNELPTSIPPAQHSSRSKNFPWFCWNFAHNSFITRPFRPCRKPFNVPRRENAEMGNKKWYLFAKKSLQGSGEILRSTFSMVLKKSTLLGCFLIFASGPQLHQNWKPIRNFFRFFFIYKYLSICEYIS